MKPERKLICDIRYSLNFAPNSVTAAEEAVGLGFKRVLLEVMFSPSEDVEDEDCYLLPMPMTPEYDLLLETPWSTWYYDYVICRQLAVPDLLDEVLAVEGLEECWFFLKASATRRNEAIEKIATQFTGATKGILIDAQPIGELPEGIKGCDPTGKQEYRLISRPENLSEDAVLMARQPPIIPQSLTLDGHPAGEYHIFSLP